jgi:HAD superfamily hydrolase (TIGR01509 family)
MEMKSLETVPEAVVFDMDGLMFNTEDLYFAVGEELLRRRGKKFTRELSDAMMGRPPQASFEIMIRWHNLSDTWEKLAAESEDLFIERIQGRVAPMPGLLELLAALESADIPKAIATSSSRRTLRAVLACCELEPRFAFTLTAEDVIQGKPHPEIYQKACEKFGLPPNKVVVLEDSEAGCQAAAAAGTITVAVPGPHSARHDFSSATIVIESLRDPRLYELLRLPQFGAAE